MALLLHTKCPRPSITLPIHFNNSTQIRRFCVLNCRTLDGPDSRKLVAEVKEKLEKDYSSLPVGKYGRDDEDMILWFLKDREFSVNDAVTRLVKAIKWREDFGVSELTEDSVESVAETGKSYVHDFLDVNGRPVLVVVASKHFPAMHDPVEDQKLCVVSIEKALSKLSAGQDQILGIIDLRGFSTENADIKFLTFLVRFCSVETVREEYFTEETMPPNFRDTLEE
ncbi:hypothetical protein Ancab_039135 [Ancistrocladus abbreviatus]